MQNYTSTPLKENTHILCIAYNYFYLFFAATNAANAIELTFVSKESALEVKITGADVPTKSPPFFDFEKYVNVLYITFAVSISGNNNISTKDDLITLDDVITYVKQNNKHIYHF